jgi:hypothetical protein
MSVTLAIKDAAAAHRAAGRRDRATRQADIPDHDYVRPAAIE